MKKDDLKREIILKWATWLSNSAVLMDMGCNIATYRCKELSNTTAAHKSCLPKGFLGFDLPTGGKNILLSLQKGAQKGGPAPTQPYFPSYPLLHHSHHERDTWGWNPPGDARPEKHILLNSIPLYDLLFEIQHLHTQHPFFKGRGDYNL